MENNKVSNNIDDLKAYIEAFLKNDSPTDCVMIHSDLRRPIRELKILFPKLFYFAYGLGCEYKLVLSKQKFKIFPEQLTPKCYNMFLKYADIKIDIQKFAITPEINQYVDVNKWLDLLSDTLLSIGCEKDFIGKHYDLEKQIATSITASPKYSEWETLVLAKKSLQYANDQTKKMVTRKDNIYTKKNDGHYFLSIDLKAANFQALRENGLIGEKSWTDFISKFTNQPYFGKLKKMRLFALSSKGLFGDKQNIWWENITLEILDTIIKHHILDENNFLAFHSDELVFRTTKDSSFYDKLAVEKFIADDTLGHHLSKYDIRIELFQLKMLCPKKKYFAKIDQSGKVVFKCIAMNEIIEAIELWNKNQ